jgi:hypothetical protein
MSWVGELWLHNYTHWVSLKLNIDENEWLKNLPMSGKNGARKRHVKTPLERKTNCPSKTS